MARGDEVVGVSELVADRFDGLSPQLRKAARYLLDHPDDVALRSMREVAKAAGLPAVTFVRLSRSLGFTDYAGLRRLFEERLRERPEARRYSRKARDLQQRGGTAGELGLLNEMFGAGIDNIERTYERNHPETLIRVAGLVETARRVFVLGQRSCYPSAFFFAYVYRMVRPNAVLLADAGGAATDALGEIGPSDLLIAISIAPYTASVVETVRFAAEAGVRIVAITDDPLSPIARVADETLLVATATPSFFHSIAAIVTLVEALLALLVARGGRQALAAIERSERQLERLGA
jgi:DNA-binding MurR/RpiR family transcriptional regulator